MINLNLSDEKLKLYFDEAIAKTIELMKIKSIADESNPQPNEPFGSEVDKALLYVLDLAKYCGMKPTIGYNHEYGYADFGTGEKLFGIVCHLDVVPSGDLSKWKKSPWEPIIENNELYGRGSLDDKGPAIINLYALKYLIDHCFDPKNYTVRIIFGLTEETTWNSIKSYLKHEREPDFAYVPDGQWPVIYAEKGIMNFDLVGPGISKIKMHSGEAYNVVCDINEISGSDQELIRKYFDLNNIEYVIENNKILGKGKSAHGSTPELGDNIAIKSLLGLKEIYQNNAPAIANFVFDNLRDNTFKMEKIFPNYHDETGDVTTNLGKLRLNSEEQRIGLNCRFPIKYQKEELKEVIDSAAKKWGLTFEFKQWEPQKYIDKNSKIIKKMMKIYQDVTGDFVSEPLAIGGGTYARALKNGLAFGACKSIDLMHNVNERIPLSELYDMLKIYIQAIQALVN